MENSINYITIDAKHLPVVTDCNILTAAENFYHMDRTAGFNVLIYVTDGKMYVTEDTTDYEIGPGELLFLKQGIRHFGKRETLRKTRWLYAHFTLDESIDEGIALAKKLSGLSKSQLEDKLFRLCSAFHDQEPSRRFRANMLLYDCLADIGFENSRTQMERLADKICSFLEEIPGQAFSEELVEKNFNMSYSYMAAEFKKDKGITMGQYHNGVRMRKACGLLRATLLPVGEIACELGFSDMLYFSRKFHSYTGLSPTEYRRKAQNEY